MPHNLSVPGRSSAGELYCMSEIFTAAAKIQDLVRYKNVFLKTFAICPCDCFGYIYI